MTCQYQRGQRGRCDSSRRSACLATEVGIRLQGLQGVIERGLADLARCATKRWSNSRIYATIGDVKYESITTDTGLRELCDRLADVEIIAFDTEFVSEDTYRPELCLLQVAAGGKLSVIDCVAVNDVDPFWQRISTGKHRTVVHAGRQEVLFCLDSVEAWPVQLFDLQIAAGLVGLEYPAGYGSLVSRLLGQQLKKGETRTDWRKRPLSERQLQYALSDVVHLEPMYRQLTDKLERLDRTAWLEGEMKDWIDQVEVSYRRERWQRVSGMSGLGARSRAVVREVWRWREEQARRRNMPPKRVLRDDLIVEIAKRRSADVKQIRAIRGMDRGDLRNALPHLAAAVQRALDLDESQLPRGKHRHELPPQLNVLGQFLSSALGSICRRAELATGIVGNPSDVRELIAYRLGYFHDDDEPPALSVGWRAEVVGQQIDDLLAGRLSIRIVDPQSEQPLTFDPVNNRGESE
ncbi:MAG: ribonuclease D [Planctomycetota bacterium]|nr:MAG: ribonuclease D [Planctomycetota bacterium]